jgi:hypothetical protein
MSGVGVLTVGMRRGGGSFLCYLGLDAGGVIRMKEGTKIALILALILGVMFILAGSMSYAAIEIPPVELSPESVQAIGDAVKQGAKEAVEDALPFGGCEIAEWGLLYCLGVVAFFIARKKSRF